MFFQLQIIFLFWLYWLCLFCCTTIRHYKFILIIPLTTEIEKSYNYVLLRIYLIMKNVCCSGRRRRCWLFFQSWVHEEITLIIYWFKITLLKHMLTMILHIYKKTCLSLILLYGQLWTTYDVIFSYVQIFKDILLLFFFGQFDIQNTVSTTPSMCITVTTNVQTRFDIIYLND